MSKSGLILQPSIGSTRISEKVILLRQLMEKIGRGTIKMIEDCEIKGYPTPVWHSNSGITTLSFKGVTVTSKTDDTVNDAVKRGVIDAVSDAVNAIATNNEGVSINEIMNKTSKSNATVKRYLQILRTINFI